MSQALDLFGDGPPLKGNDRNSGYDREADDWYVEPPRAWHALLDVETFEGGLWDPCCGLGTGPKVAAARGLPVRASDLVARGFDGADRANLFACSGGAANVVTNPPYDDISAVITHTLRLAQRKVALLLPLARLEGQKRGLLFQSTPFARLYAFSGRIACPPGRLAMHMTDRQRDDESGAIAYAWFVWDHAHAGPATIHFLP